MSLRRLGTRSILVAVPVAFLLTWVLPGQAITISPGSAMVFGGVACQTVGEGYGPLPGSLPSTFASGDTGLVTGRCAWDITHPDLEIPVYMQAHSSAESGSGHLRGSVFINPVGNGDAHAWIADELTFLPVTAPFSPRLSVTVAGMINTASAGNGSVEICIDATCASQDTPGIVTLNVHQPMAISPFHPNSGLFVITLDLGLTSLLPGPEAESVDFSNSAVITVEGLPPGVTFTSASGVFLVCQPGSRVFNPSASCAAPAAIPEPSTLFLLVAGLVSGKGFALWQRRVRPQDFSN